MEIKTQKLVLIDWDDTIFPTVWAKENGISLRGAVDVNIKDLLNEIDTCVSATIFKILESAQVRIVTNGSRLWINMCLNFLPVIQVLVSNHIIGLISARDLYIDKVSDCIEWKRLAFERCVEVNLKDSLSYHHQHILSLGDSPAEHMALMKLKHFSLNLPKETRILKSVRFMVKPHFADIIRQWNVLYEKMEDVLTCNKNKIYKM